MQKKIRVADFSICLTSDSEHEFFLEESYLPFESTETFDIYDVTISVVNGIPDALLAQGDMLYEAKDSKQNYFSIEKLNDDYKFRIYDQKNIGEIQQIAVLTGDFKKWTIYSNALNEEAIKYPLLYPMGPLILYYLTVRYDALMIHASGVYDGSKGRIFSGFSGVGKSTMAYLWQSENAGIVNDDRLIIRKSNGKYCMYNTPMYYADIPKKTPLDAIHLIRHAPENEINKIEGIKAVSRIMAFCIQHGYRRDFINHHLEFISSMCDEVAVYEVGFVPDKSIVDFIRSNA